MRRLALAGGSTGLAATTTLSVYMGALGLGALLSPHLKRSPLRTYGLLELSVAAWVVVAPSLLEMVGGWLAVSPWTRTTVLALVLLAPPGLAHGATLPVLARACPDRSSVAGLYAWNTTGAVAGTLLWTFVVLPLGGVRVAEWSAALLAVGIGLRALQLGDTASEADSAPPLTRQSGRWVVPAAAVAGAAAMAVEVCAARVGAQLIGGSVYAFALVLAVFLAGIGLGAGLARRLDQSRHVGHSLAAMGAAIVLFCASWRVLPHGVATLWRVGGDLVWMPGAALLFALVLGPVALASGATFTLALRDAEGTDTASTARVLAANTAGSVLGAGLAGMLGLPLLGLWGTALAAAGVCLVGVSTSPFQIRLKVAAVAILCTVAALVPRFDPALYAVGLGLRVSEFADLSPRAVERFAHEGWELLSYEDGVTTTVAVGRSTSSGNIWLSLNGKVDASTGLDMATQELSGVLPVAIAQAHVAAPDTVVVGLASGVTAARALSSGASQVEVLEVEPAVVEAARYFREANADLLDDPRATITVADARAWLSRPGPRHDVIISEPSNPWLTGVSNLFTQEYWQLSRARLADDGVFCQWVQLYALPPDAFRGLVRTFLTVYPNAWLFESIPGADALLIAAPSLPDGLPVEPTLGPAELQRLASYGPLVTDDQPWVEFQAPFWVHEKTGGTNQALIEAAR